MNDHDQEEIGKLLREAFPLNEDEDGAEAGPRRDLWPAMMQRIEGRGLETRRAPVPWYDWALASGLAVALAVFPSLLLALAFHL